MYCKARQLTVSTLRVALGMPFAQMHIRTKLIGWLVYGNKVHGNQQAHIISLYFPEYISQPNCKFAVALRTLLESLHA